MSNSPLGFIPDWQFNPDPKINPYVNPHVSMPPGMLQAGAYYSQPQYPNQNVSTGSYLSGAGGLHGTIGNNLCSPASANNPLCANILRGRNNGLGMPSIDWGVPGAPVGVPWGVKNLVASGAVPYGKRQITLGGQPLGFVMVDENPNVPPTGVPWGMKKDGPMLFNQGFEKLRTGNYEDQSLGFSLPDNPFDSFWWRNRKTIVLTSAAVVGLAALSLLGVFGR